MSDQDKLNQESLEEPGKEQDPETSPTIPEKSIINQTETDERREEIQKRNLIQQKKRSKSGAKGKLVRSLAVCEDTSPRGFGDDYPDNQECIHLHLSSPSDLQEDINLKDDSEKDKDRSKDREKTFEKTKARTLSKECSQEYTDSTGIDLHEFLINTLKNNSRDRMILLKMEQEIIEFINDNNNHYKKFPQMSSYQRMLVHRVAAYFGMDHNVDQSGKSVIINKTSNTRIPEQRFCEHLKDEKGEDSQKRFILKRDNSSIDKEDNQSVCSQENIFMEIRLSEETGICNDIQKKRQLFRGNRDGSGKASGSRQSSTENDLKWADQRPWSSTDSESSNRNLKPAITKNASFGGITVLTRGDSSASSRSTGKLSKTGSSESSSSAGSSGSLSRLHQPPQSTSIVSGTSISSTGNIPFSENGITSSNTSYIILPLDAAGIPPGSILLNPHTGQPFVNPDGTPAIYNPPSGQQAMRAPVVGQSQQQTSSHPQQTQQPMQGHLVSQALQNSSQPVQYPAVSYQQHLLPVSPTQQFQVRGDDITSQFNQINLSRQSSGETPEPTSGPVFPSAILTQPSQQTSFVISSSNQQIAPGSFTGSGQSVTLQPPPQGYVQQSPAQYKQGRTRQRWEKPKFKMPVYYYPSGQYPTSANQQYRPVASVQYNAQRSPQIPPAPQQTGYQPVLSSQQQGFQGLLGMQQPPQSQNLINNQQGSQVQGMMVQYPSISSYQVQMPQNSQGIPQQSYQQQIMLPNLSGQGTLTAPGMPVYCNVMPPSQQTNLRLITPHCPNSNVPVISSNCRTNCSNMTSPGWQVKY
ncbi:cAMP-regulated phosphoprotein 21-like isoform X1 [Bombina bombina]|uniref:cAMP-regulated phosphoprotein 21-like isoform X1 n=1 Tax=Bombina bombina TaxID=8345 RepID=UPI00235ACA39|nr:cAMP-regulated phosphoprotein 21-like isoform X1 [Bombina bombina]